MCGRSFSLLFCPFFISKSEREKSDFPILSSPLSPLLLGGKLGRGNQIKVAGAGKSSREMAASERERERVRVRPQFGRINHGLQCWNLGPGRHFSRSQHIVVHVQYTQFVNVLCPQPSKVIIEMGKSWGNKGTLITFPREGENRALAQIMIECRSSGEEITPCGQGSEQKTRLVDR